MICGLNLDRRWLSLWYFLLLVLLLFSCNYSTLLIHSYEPSLLSSPQEKWRRMGWFGRAVRWWEAFIKLKSVFRLLRGDLSLRSLSISRYFLSVFCYILLAISWSHCDSCDDGKPSVDDIFLQWSSHSVATAGIIQQVVVILKPWSESVPPRYIKGDKYPQRPYTRILLFTCYTTLHSSIYGFSIFKRWFEAKAKSR